MSRLRDLTGQTFTRLIVLRRVENIRNEAAWLCCCDCGATRVVRGYSLRNGDTRSCGCLQREKAKALAPIAAVTACENRRAKPAAHVSYRTAHKRVQRAKGLASTHPCIDCGNQAQDWSLRRDATETYEGRNGKHFCLYSGNPDDYEPRCKGCHLAYDRGDS